jgi:ketosteroid isomerase-like protein
MSQENVEIVRQVLRESNETGRTPTEDLHPEVEWHLDHAHHPDQRTLRGVEEVVEYFRGWFDAFDEARIEPDAYIDSDEYVVVPFVGYGRLRGSSAEVSLNETWVFRVQGKLIREVWEYVTPEEALKAVGLEE